MADTSVSVGRRAKTTVAQQALIMLNHPLVLSQSRLAADRWSRTGVTVDELLEEIAMASYGRPLTETEKQFLMSYFEPLDRSNRYDRDKLSKVIQTIFASIDFRYVE